MKKPATVDPYLAALAPDQRAAYETTGRGTLRFRPDAPPPAALVRKLVEARIANNAARSTAKSTARATRKSTSRRR